MRLSVLGPFGGERHRARAEAVHAALPEGGPDWRVQSWGTHLDDREQTQEVAHFVIEWLRQVAQGQLVHSAVQQGVAVAGDAVKDLGKDGLVEIAKFIGSAMVVSLITRFHPSVKSKKGDNVYAEADSARLIQGASETAEPKILCIWVEAGLIGRRSSPK